MLAYRLPKDMAPKMAKRTKKGVSKIDRSQTFSLDILIALGIFLVGIVVFLMLIGGKAGDNLPNKLVNEAEMLPQKLIASDEYSTTNTTFVVGNKVESELLNKTLSKDYYNFKRELDIVSDFCVHFEDEAGNMVDLNEDPCIVQYSIGDSRYNLTIIQNGVESIIPCGSVEVIC